MNPRAVVLTAALAAATAAVIVAALLPLRPGRALAAPAHPLTVRATLTPGAVEFGDAVTARVVVTTDAHDVRSSSLHVVFGVAPLTQLSRTVERHATRGDTRIATYTLRAACLSDACVTTTGRRTVIPEAAHADAVRTDGTPLTATADWSPLTIGGRVTPGDLGATKLPFRAATSPPPASFRIDPGKLAALLDVAAAMLAACGVGLGTATLLRARRRRRPEQQADELARALRLARSAGARPERDRRTALGYLARVLGRRGEPLADSAGELAWSRPAPAPDALTEVVEGVERERRG